MKLNLVEIRGYHLGNDVPSGSQVSLNKHTHVQSKEDEVVVDDDDDVADNDD